MKLIGQYCIKNVQLLETKWRGLNAYDLSKNLKRDETSLRSFPNISPLFTDARNTPGNILTINNHGYLMTLSNYDILSTIQITDTEESGNSNSACNAVKCVTESNIIYRDDCATKGRLSIKLALVISHEFSTYEKYAFMQFEPQLSGSILEQAKCYFPDECDILCRFSQSSILKHDYASKHSVSFSATNDNNLETLLNAEGEVIKSCFL